MIIAYDDCVNSYIDQAYYDELSNSLRIEAVKCSACKQVGFKVPLSKTSSESAATYSQSSLLYFGFFVDTFKYSAEPTSLC